MVQSHDDQEQMGKGQDRNCLGADGREAMGRVEDRIHCYGSRGVLDALCALEDVVAWGVVAVGVVVVVDDAVAGVALAVVAFVVGSWKLCCLKRLFGLLWISASGLLRMLLVWMWMQIVWELVSVHLGHLVASGVRYLEGMLLVKDLVVVFVEDPVGALVESLVGVLAETLVGVLVGNLVGGLAVEVVEVLVRVGVLVGGR